MRQLLIVAIATLFTAAPVSGQGNVGAQGYYRVPPLSSSGVLSAPIYGPQSCTTPAFAFVAATTSGVGYTPSKVCIVIGGTEVLGVSASAVTSTVPVVVPDGSAGAPSIRRSASQTGFFFEDQFSVLFGENGIPDIRLGRTGDAGYLGFYFNSSIATYLISDAANVIAQRNGTNAQTFNVYQTYTSATDFYRTSLYSNYASASGGLILEKGAATADAALPLYIRNATNGSIDFGTNSASRWQIGASGHFLANGAYNIGDGAGNSPVNIYTEGQIITPDHTYGSDSTPQYAVNGDATTGFRYRGGGEIAYVSGSTLYWRMRGARLIASDAATLEWGESQRSIISSPADGQFNWTNAAASAGVLFTFSSDGKYTIGTRSGGTAATQLGSSQSTDPTCTSNCGTSPTVIGSDSEFRVTMGSSGSPASGWVITYNGTWDVAPVCSVTMGLAGMAVGKMAIVVATTTTTMTVTTNGTAPSNSDVYHVLCRAPR
jgi:hypothetical protein